MLFAKSFLFAKTNNTNHLYNSGSRLLRGKKTKQNKTQGFLNPFDLSLPEHSLINYGSIISKALLACS